MLRVTTYLDRSTVHGIGLFAGETIEAGRRIWEYNPEIDLSYSRDRWLQMLRGLEEEVRRTLRRLSYKEGGRIHLCLDNAQFMNHSRQRCNVGNDRLENVMYALAEVTEGEELLCDYFAYSDPDDYHLAFLSGPEPV